MVNPKDIKLFVQSIEDATEDTALYYLEMCNGNLNEALSLYFELNGAKEATHNNNNNNRKQNEESVVKPSKVPQTPNDFQEEFVRAPDKHFSQALIHDMDASNFIYYDQKKKEKKVDLGNDSFGQLFSPPKEIICSLSFEEARKKAKSENKFLLVNIQNSEFDSMKLNRDIWKNETIQEIIKDFFILWLRFENDPDALLFMNTYKVTTLPYICVLCKRTGRQLKIWNFKQFEDCVCAQSQLYEFIETMESNNTNDLYRPSPMGSELKQPSSNNSTSKISGTSGSANKDSLSKNAIKSTVNNTNKTSNTVSKDSKERNTPNPTPDAKQKDTSLANTNVEEYNKINNELSELHKLRMKRMNK